jgi:hypothetical protein
MSCSKLRHPCILHPQTPRAEITPYAMRSSAGTRPPAWLDWAALYDILRACSGLSGNVKKLEIELKNVEEVEIARGYKDMQQSFDIM